MEEGAGSPYMVRHPTSADSSPRLRFVAENWRPNNHAAEVGCRTLSLPLLRNSSGNRGPTALICVLFKEQNRQGGNVRLSQLALLLRP